MLLRLTTTDIVETDNLSKRYLMKQRQMQKKHFISDEMKRGIR